MNDFNCAEVESAYLYGFQKRKRFKGKVSKSKTHRSIYPSNFRSFSGCVRMGKRIGHRPTSFQSNDHSLGVVSI